MKTIAFVILCFPLSVLGQIPFNTTVTNPEADQILKGIYNPSHYLPGTVINSPSEIACVLNQVVSADSLHSYLLRLGSFHNRNTYSDTVSNSTGIGAARRWVHEKFLQFSAQNENRLVPSYLQFEMDSTALCGSGRFRNIFAVLPGSDTSDKSVIIIEAHIDTRCEDVCDINCSAEGADDNGSGTALVLELSRVLSKFSFNHTIVFLITIGEEQGLYGADAFAKYAEDNGILIKVVQNNDIVGGIFCGETSSPPSCPAEDHIDSTQVRIFSLGGVNSSNKSYARFVKLMYGEWLSPLASVPMTVNIMQPEDRSGRGGDHIPFRQRGFTAIRFSSANEHGDGDPSDSTYHDRQHSTRDILGADTDNDSVLDSFFVDFNFLARNTAINGIAAAIAGLGPKAPTIQVSAVGNSMRVSITDAKQHLHYRIGVRGILNDFEAIYTVKDSQAFSLPGMQIGSLYRVSAASVNSAGVMSLFSNEVSFYSSVNSTSHGDTLKFESVDCTNVGVEEHSIVKSIVRMFIKPNPFNQTTQIGIEVNKELINSKALVVVCDILGRTVNETPIILNSERNIVSFNKQELQPGIYFCSLMLSGVNWQSEKMIVVN